MKFLPLAALADLWTGFPHSYKFNFLDNGLMKFNHIWQICSPKPGLSTHILISSVWPLLRPRQHVLDKAATAIFSDSVYSTDTKLGQFEDLMKI